MRERTERDVAIDVVERFIRGETGIGASEPHLLSVVREQSEDLVRRLEAAGALAAYVRGTTAEATCPSCGATIRSRLGDQSVIEEFKEQGWRPPLERG